MADYAFSSVVGTEGDKRVNRMHVMAYGSKFRRLQMLMEQELTVRSREDTPTSGGIEVEYFGSKGGVDYDVTLACGLCSIEDGAQGHLVEIRTPQRSRDRLSPIIKHEMRKYEEERAIKLRLEQSGRVGELTS